MSNKAASKKIRNQLQKTQNKRKLGNSKVLYDDFKIVAQNDVFRYLELSKSPFFVTYWEQSVGEKTMLQFGINNFNG